MIADTTNWCSFIPGFSLESLFRSQGVLNCTKQIDLVVHTRNLIDDANRNDVGLVTKLCEHLPTIVDVIHPARLWFKKFLGDDLSEHRQFTKLLSGFVTNGDRVECCVTNTSSTHVLSSILTMAIAQNKNLEWIPKNCTDSGSHLLMQMSVWSQMQRPCLTQIYSIKHVVIVNAQHWCTAESSSDPVKLCTEWQDTNWLSNRDVNRHGCLKINRWNFRLRGTRSTGSSSRCTRSIGSRSRCTRSTGSGSNCQARLLLFRQMLLKFQWIVDAIRIYWYDRDISSRSWTCSARKIIFFYFVFFSGYFVFFVFHLWRYTTAAFNCLCVFLISLSCCQMTKHFTLHCLGPSQSDTLIQVCSGRIFVF